MNRTSAAALAVAAVIGIAGGTYTASVGIGTDDDGGRQAGEQKTSRTPSPTKSATDEETRPPSSPAQLLYMDAGQIHDGYTHVEFEDLDLKSVAALVRIRGGWLVVTSDGPDETALSGTVVTGSGEQTDLGSFEGSWDINADGTQFVALFEDGYRVLTLSDATEVDVDLSAPPGSTATATAAFAGDAVLTGWTASTEVTTLRTDLTTGRRKAVPTGQLTGWTASPRGLLMAGEVVDEATSCLEGGRVLGDHDDWWRTCDWRGYGLRPQYSADGEQLLVVPADTEGLGPTLYAVLDSETGRVTEEIAPPESTVAAEWGDNDEVFVLVQKGARSGRAIYRCRLGEECTKEKESATRLVLGAGV
jgi:hypothetical protein